MKKTRNSYSEKTIAKACALYEKGVPLRAIMEKTGIKSTSTIQFACSPEYKAKQIERTAAWRKANPERWREINTKAVRKYQKKQKRPHGEK